MSVLFYDGVRVYSVSKTENGDVGILFNLRVINLNDPGADTVSPTGICFDISPHEAEKLRDFLTSVLKDGKTRLS